MKKITSYLALTFIVISGSANASNLSSSNINTQAKSSFSEVSHRELDKCKKYARSHENVSCSKVYDHPRSSEK